MDIHLILVMTHIVGVILGVGGATLAEVFFLVALKDGEVDAGEKRLMHANYKFLRVGLAISVLSGIALVWWWVSAEGTSWLFENPKVWVKNAIVVVIVVNAWLIAKRKVPMWLGASLSFTSWWTATVLGAWRGIPYSFVEIVVGYIIAIFVMAGILELIRKYYHRKT